VGGKGQGADRRGILGLYVEKGGDLTKGEDNVLMKKREVMEREKEGELEIQSRQERHKEKHKGKRSIDQTWTSNGGGRGEKGREMQSLHVGPKATVVKKLTTRLINLK